jgi:2Fe-2S ferredoxin
MESDMLDFVLNPDARSRLGCQLVMTEALDGLVVYVPKRQA